MEWNPTLHVRKHNGKLLFLGALYQSFPVLIASKLGPLQFILRYDFQNTKQIFSQNPSLFKADLHYTCPYSGSCFGKIKFVEEDGTHQPDYVRISDDMMSRKSGCMRVMELLETRWRLPRPNLIISGAYHVNHNRIYDKYDRSTVIKRSVISSSLSVK